MAIIDPNGYTYNLGNYSADAQSLWDALTPVDSANPAQMNSGFSLSGILEGLKSATGLTGQQLAALGLGGVGTVAALTEGDKVATNQSTNTAQTASTTAGTSQQQQAGSSENRTLQEQMQEYLSQADQEAAQTTAQQQDTQDWRQQKTETTTPDWYLDLLKKQAAGIEDIGSYQGFNKNLPDMPIESYMNKYLENAMNPVLRRMEEDQAKERQAFDAQRVSRGAFGTARSDLMNQQLRERQGLERQNLLSSAYNQAYNTGTGQAMTDLNRQFEDWKLQQQDPRALAGAKADVLKTLDPGRGTSVTSTGGQTGITSGANVTSTLGTTSGINTGTAQGTQVGTTANTQTGQNLGSNIGNTTGTTTGTSTQGAPNTAGKLFGLGSQLYGLMNPTQLPKPQY